jgi:hypothetical protein
MKKFRKSFHKLIYTLLKLSLSMRYILLFESFVKKDFVTYNGENGKVVSTSGNDVEIEFFNGEIKTVDKDDKNLEKMKRCTGLCDKQIVMVDGERQIKCFGCDRVLTKVKKKKKRRGVK